MNRLPRDKQIQIITALVEGCSIRSVERMCNVHRDTVMRLLVRTGNHCMTLLEDNIQNVRAEWIQADEIWTFCGKKDARLKAYERYDPTKGSQHIWVAMDGITKLVIAHRVGKRELLLAMGLTVEVRQRVVGHPMIVTDGLVFYFDAVQQYFGRFGCDFAQLVKTVKPGGARIREGYTTPKLVTCKPYPLFGNPDPDRISTSYIERQNWTIRTFMRRLTRMSNGFSRKLENLKAATALHFAHYNFCRIHSTLRVTPAMAAGIVDTLWSVDALVPN